MKPVANLADIQAIESQGWPSDLPESTYELIRTGVAINPEAPALSFFMKAEDHREAEAFSYRDLFRRITQTANFFHCLGVGKDDVISFLLPNLPETHFTIWGGQAAGIVAAFNHLLEAQAAIALLKSVRTKVLVTIAPFPGTDLFSRLQSELTNVDCLEHLVLVNLADRVRGPAQPAARKAQEREVERVCGSGGIRGKVSLRISIHERAA